MHTIEVIGPECPRGLRTLAAIREVVDRTQVDAVVRHVTEPSEIVARGVLFAVPGVAVDGVLVSTGRIPSHKDVERWLGIAPGAPAR